MTPNPGLYANPEFVPRDYFRVAAAEDLFGGGGPIEIDVGCGDGGFLLAQARHFPERRFLGIERLRGRVDKVVRAARRENLVNLRILRLESRYSLEYLLPESCASAVHILFPDPWPKKRHHPRRLVQASLLPALERVLRPQGRLFFKTDDPEYFAAAREVLEAAPFLLPEPWPTGRFYPPTDFEKQWVAAGRDIQRACFRKR